MIRLFKLLALPLLAVFLMFGGQANAKGDIYTGTFNNVAVSGYDTVAYFTEGKPVKGSKDFTSEYKGAQWHFASERNLKAFKAEPTKYAPQYGGHCAFGAANGDLIKADPNAWHILDGKLYLNYNLDIQKQWLQNPADYISKANANFPNLVH